jgi:hypothetical protein
MRRSIKSILLAFVWFFASAHVTVIFAEPAKLTEAEGREAMAMIASVNCETFAYKASVMRRMLVEANYFSEQLKLPTSQPIQIADVRYPGFSLPWFSVIKETDSPHFPISIFKTNIFNSAIPREQRLRALVIGVRGIFETTNFLFGFKEGKLWETERLNQHLEEYCASIPDLNKLAVTPSVIDDSQAYELAKRWLATVDVDVQALGEKYQPKIRQPDYSYPPGTTNKVKIPIFFVEWGSRNFSNEDGSISGSEPLVAVKILGTTKELVELRMQDTSFSHRPTIIITNAFDLICAPNPPIKRLESLSISGKNSP